MAKTHHLNKNEIFNGTVGGGYKKFMKFNWVLILDGKWTLFREQNSSSIFVTELKGFICLHPSKPTEQEEEFATKKIKAYLRKWRQTWRHR